jgi:hypothetical protein
MDLNAVGSVPQAVGDGHRLLDLLDTYAALEAWEAQTIAGTKHEHGGHWTIVDFNGLATEHDELDAFGSDA